MPDIKVAAPSEITLGARGAEVYYLQQRLKALGLSPGRADGIFGSSTREAVLAFQVQRGLKQSGVLDAATWQALETALNTPPAPAVATGLSIDRSMRLPDDQYIPEKHPKSLIVLHHTAGGSARSTFRWWMQDPKRIATAYIVERDGTIYEVFDPRCWAYHLGLKKVSDVHERRSIGIEIASEGGLRPEGGRLYRFGKVAPNYEFKGQHYDHGNPWRGYQHYAAYTPQQMASVTRLVDHLCDAYSIPRQTPSDHFSYNKACCEYTGIIGHHHVREDKSDLHPGFDWNGLVSTCRLSFA